MLRRNKCRMLKKRVLRMSKTIILEIFLLIIDQVVLKITSFISWEMLDSLVLLICRRVIRILKGLLVENWKKRLRRVRIRRRQGS